MIRHYLTFLRQAELLDDELRGWVLAECWSQEKNRLNLHFIRERNARFAEIAVDLRIGYALPSSEIHRARRNTIDFFERLLGARLRSATIDDAERMIRFAFDGERELLALFFGAGSGNVLLVENGAVAASFQEADRDYGELVAGHEEIVTRGMLLERLREDSRPIGRALGAALPRIGKRLAAEALYRTRVDEAAQPASMSAEDLMRLLDEVDRLYGECLSSDTFRHYHLPDEVVFALTRLRHLEEIAEKVEEFTDLARAVRVFRSVSFSSVRFSSTKSRLERQLEKEIRRIEKGLEHARDTSGFAERAAEYEMNGNLLLANLHVVERGIDRCELSDWEGNSIVVKLDPKLTPAENADRYFTKARKTREEREHAERRGIEAAKRLEGLRALEGELERAGSVEELERIESGNANVFRMKGEAKEQGSAERFRRFVVDGGHEVYAGKNAANNDELTLRFARPNDIWLHARGSSGSHVVLRWNDQKLRPPKRALEEAAQIAAYYSGAKNSRLVPVAWTFKKYVRKPKGAAPGSVLVNREEVVMVEPKLPAGSEAE